MIRFKQRDKMMLSLLVIMGLSACGTVVRTAVSITEDTINSPLFHLGRHGKLSEREMEWAKTAWQYFANNIDANTGVAGEIDNQKISSPWTIADTLSAIFSAHQLKFIDDREFDERVTAVLNALNTMPLYDEALPNHYYDITNLNMIDKNNNLAETGWSAKNLGRLLIWLEIIDQHYPAYSEYIQKALLRWNFCEVVTDCGELKSAIKYDGQEVDIKQDLRLGYEEYSALGYKILGFNTDLAEKINPVETKVILGIRVPYDGRNARETGVPVTVDFLPYILYGIEFNWDKLSKRPSVDSLHSQHNIANIAQILYQVQKKRFQEKKIITARSRYQLSNPPYEIDNSIYSDGFEWNTIGVDGEYYPDRGLVSTAAAFGLWSLWPNTYTEHMMEVIEHLYDSERGWYEGRYEETSAYEKTITASTNAIVLSALTHKKIGKFYTVKHDETYSDILLKDMFSRPGQCFPADRKICVIKEYKNENLQ